MKTHKIKGDKCISCGRMTNLLDKDGMCILCKTGVGGKTKSVKPSPSEELYFIKREIKYNNSK